MILNTAWVAFLKLSLTKVILVKENTDKPLCHSPRTWLPIIINSTAALCMLSDDIFDYQYVSQGKVDADSVNDGEDMQFTHVRETLLLATRRISSLC